MDAPTASPLQWPAGWPRTPAPRRQFGRFSQQREGVSYRTTGDITVATALGRLQTELERLGATAVVVSTNLDVRRDGLPRSGQRDPADPGVCVYFHLSGKATSLPCDRYTTVAANIAAIAAHINATRAIERYGVATVAAMFAGFQAIAAPDDWRSILDNPRTLAEAEATYRRKMMTAHPDVGGTDAQAAALTAAITEARKVLSHA